MSGEESEYADSVQKLGIHMVDKLEANSHKGRWEDLEPLTAFKLLLKESAELLEAVHNGYAVIDVWREAADVANFALMIAENYEKQQVINDKYVAEAKLQREYAEQGRDMMGRYPGDEHFGVPF